MAIKTYTSTKPVYTGGLYFKPGEPFTTDEPKGEDWAVVNKAEKAAIDASKPLAGDPPLEGLGLQALQAIAVEKRVDPTGLDKPALISAIKAANEPNL
jgi:hypothetical protein